jgi:hypothetical protein
MAQRPPSLIALAIFVAIVAIGAGVGTTLLYNYNHQSAPSGPLAIAAGDNATVNYIGLFGSGPEQGRVFDTSLWTVATQNLTYPKSLNFSFRGNESAYTPLGVHIGSSTPSGGYTIGNDTFVGVVPGFWQGLIGLAVNQTRWISIPPLLGYGPLNTSCVKSAPLITTLSVDVSEPIANFTHDFPGVLVAGGVEFPDPTWGWPDLIITANATAVYYENLATVGWTASPNGWPVTVTSLSATTITLTNELTASDAGRFLGQVSGGPVCGSSKYILWGVDLANGTYLENFNAEVVGETLIFQVTAVKIFPA